MMSRMSSSVSAGLPPLGGMSTPVVLSGCPTGRPVLMNQQLLVALIGNGLAGRNGLPNPSMPAPSSPWRQYKPGCTAPRRAPRRRRRLAPVGFIGIAGVGVVACVSTIVAPATGARARTSQRLARTIYDSSLFFSLCCDPLLRPTWQPIPFGAPASIVVIVPVLNARATTGARNVPNLYPDRLPQWLCCFIPMLIGFSSPLSICAFSSAKLSTVPPSSVW